MAQNKIQMPPYLNASYEIDDLYTGDQVRELIERAVAKEQNECKKLCAWQTGNQFVDEAIAICYRSIDLRGEA